MTFFSMWWKIPNYKREETKRVGRTSNRKAIVYPRVPDSRNMNTCQVITYTHTPSAPLLFFFFLITAIYYNHQQVIF